MGISADPPQSLEDNLLLRTGRLALQVEAISVWVTGMCSVS